MYYFNSNSSIDKGGSSSQQSVRDHPQGGFDPKGVVSTRGRFYKIDQGTFRNFDSNVTDTNIKL
jgi:hypothetical protein